MPDFNAWLKTISVTKAITAGAVILGALILWFVLKRAYTHYAGKKGGKSKLARITVSLLRALMATIVILMILDICGVNQKFITVLSQSVKNFLA